MRASCSPNRTDQAAAGTERLYALDLLRWLSFYAVCAFHITYALWARYGLAEIPFRGPWVWPLENFARSFAFSGFAIMGLSFFLYGLKGARSKKARALPALLALFALAWTAGTGDLDYWWDIYPFLLCALGVIELARRARMGARAMTIAGAALLWLPLWRLETMSPFPDWITMAAFGLCRTRTDLGDWPLLPWIGLPLFAFGAGRWTASNRNALARLGWAETLVWLVALGTSLPILGAYFHVRLGEEFGCDMFRHPPWQFWAHIVWIGVAVRLSLVPGVNARSSALRVFSKSPVNRAFFLVYFAHYPFVFLLAAGARKFELDREAWIFPILWLIVMWTVELSPVVIRSALDHNKWGDLWPRTSAKSSTT